jgi:hypothetical protein
VNNAVAEVDEGRLRHANEGEGKVLIFQATDDERLNKREINQISDLGLLDSWD